MTAFNELMKSGKRLEKLNSEGKTTKEDLVYALEALIKWCETDDTEELLQMGRTESHKSNGDQI